MRRLRALAPLAALLLAAPASANERFACDAPLGRVTTYQRVVGPAPLKVSATFQVNEMRADKNWRPVINIQLSGGKVELRAGFRILGDPATNKVVIFAVFPGMKADQAVPIGETTVKTPMTVTITGTDKGTQLAVNGLGRSGPGLVPGNWLLDLSCSSVDAHIASIVVSKN